MLRLAGLQRGETRERSNGELNAIFVHRGMHNKLSNVFILRKLRARHYARIGVDGGEGGGGGGGLFRRAADYNPIIMPALMSHCPSLDPSYV